MQLESVLWGLGTALGELPPYFISKAAALTNNLNLPDELNDIKAIQNNKLKRSFVDTVKLFIFKYL